MIQRSATVAPEDVEFAYAQVRVVVIDDHSQMKLIYLLRKFIVQKG